MPRDPPVTNSTRRLMTGSARHRLTQLMPPKPNEFFSMTSMRVIDRAVAADVEIHLGIELVDVDRLMQPAGPHLQHGRDGLDRRRRPAGVAEHRLRRVDAQLLRVIAEHALDRAQLRQVAERRRGGVRVDVVDILRAQAGVGNDAAHHDGLPVFRRLRQVVAVRIGRAAEHLGVDAGAAAFRGVELLEHQRRAAVRGHEAFAARVVGPARARRLVVEVLKGDRAHQRHRVHVDRRELEHGADHHRHLRAVVADLVDRRAQRDVAARARRADGVDRSARLQHFRHAAGMIGVERIERRHAVDEVRLFLELAAAVELIERIEVVARDDHRLTMRVVVSVKQAGIAPAIDRQQHRQLRRPWHFRDQLAQPLVHVGRDQRLQRRELGGDVVGREIAADLAVDALGRECLPAARSPNARPSTRR